MGFKQILREEFRLNKFLLRFSSRRCFYRCQWPIPPWVFLIYRIIVALYTLTWLLYATLRNPFGGQGHFQLAYLTIWTYIVLVIHLIWAANVSVLCYCYSGTRLIKRVSDDCSVPEGKGEEMETYDNPTYEGEDQRDPDVRDASPTTNAESKGTSSQKSSQNFNSSNVDIDNTPTPSVVIIGTDTNTDADADADATKWFNKVSWVLLNILTSWALIVTAIYYGALYRYILAYFDTLSYFPAGIYATDLHLHGLNSLIVLIEVVLAAYPIRILHFIYPMLYGVTYVIWSVIYWSLDPANNVLYPGILDWNTPGSTVLVMLGVLVVILVLQFIWFLIHCFKMYLFERFFPTSKHL